MMLNLAGLLFSWAQYGGSPGAVPFSGVVLLLAQCAGAVLGGILCALQILGFWKDWHFSWHKTAALLRLCAPIAVIALIGILYQKISVYMVSTLVDPATTGWFSAALRVI
jgi:O-antigen/teichoic acid export membrane protein